MEETLLEWIVERHSKMLQISRKIIRKKAIVLYEDLRKDDPERNDDKFQATEGWLFKFMKRNNLSLGRKTSVGKIASYILRVRRLQTKYSDQPFYVIAFDETPVWADTVSTKSVTMKTAGHEKCRVTSKVEKL